MTVGLYSSRQRQTGGGHGAQVLHAQGVHVLYYAQFQHKVETAHTYGVRVISKRDGVRVTAKSTRDRKTVFT